MIATSPQRKNLLDRFLNSKRAMLIALLVFFALALASEWLMPSSSIFHS